MRIIMLKKLVTSFKKPKSPPTGNPKDVDIYCPFCGFTVKRIVQEQLRLPIECPKCGKYTVQEFKEKV
jgi:rubrerythrin